MEPIWNFHWGIMAIGLLRLYHYLVLQPLSFATDVNLNSMMCPAISDPFRGWGYRVVANMHQTLFIFLHGKIYCFIGSRFFAPKAISTLTVTTTASTTNGVSLNGKQAAASAINGNDRPKETTAAVNNEPKKSNGFVQLKED
jgi:hypothetical protein